MKIDRLQELKQKLTNEADLSHIWLFYMDHFADHPEFTELGETIYNEYLNGGVSSNGTENRDKEINSKIMAKFQPCIYIAKTLANKWFLTFIHVYT